MRKKNNSGYTIIELIIALSLLVFAVTAIYNVFISSNKNLGVQVSATKARQNARSALEFLAGKIREAMAVESISTDNIVFFSIGASSSSNGKSSGKNTASTLNDASKTWEMDSWADKYVRITRGIGAGQTMAVESNSATQLVLGADWSTIPDNTSAYHIGVEKEVFSWSGAKNQILYTKGKGPAKVYFENIYSLVFTWDADPPGTGRIDIELQAGPPGKDKKKNAQQYFTVKTTVSLRSKI